MTDPAPSAPAHGQPDAARLAVARIARLLGVGHARRCFAALLEQQQRTDVPGAVPDPTNAAGDEG